MEFLVALIVALVLTPVAAAVARRTGLVDRPGPLKPQALPVPYLGGVAVLGAAVVGALAAGRPFLLVPLGLAFALGVVDDVRDLRPTVRLGVEVLLGVVAVGVVPGGVLARVATGGLVVVMVNAVNLLDGQDGLAASVGAVAAGGLALLGGDAEVVGWALVGGLLGFLVFNRPPARIYLGDGGAYLLGTALALLVPLTSPHGWSIWFAAPLLLCVPVVDTSVAVVRRVRAGNPVFTGDRSHVYDQLVDRGMTVGGSTSVLASAQVCFSAVGVVVADHAPLVALLATLVAAVVTAAVVWRARFV